MSLHLRLGWLLQVRLPIAARRGFFLLTAWLCFRAGLGGPARPWPFAPARFRGAPRRPSLACRASLGIHASRPLHRACARSASVILREGTCVVAHARLSSTTSIQCRTAVLPAPAKWLWQPTFAVTITSGLPLSSALSR